VSRGLDGYSAFKGDAIFLASMSPVEYLVEKRRLPDKTLRMLQVALTDFSFGFRLVPLDLRVVDALAYMPRDEVPDLLDYVIGCYAAVECSLPASSTLCEVPWSPQRLAVYSQTMLQ
jgi:hypothetical protein